MDVSLTDASWRKSSYSTGSGGACVEVADGFTDVQPVRDSKDPDGPVLLFSSAVWQSFVSAVRAGELGSD
ncbi:DUF397 domain-containing protein [Kitasatospora sp. NPDC058397]|uniref:DUF397 domain-containing protein n=1 Tax=unclassified Kitasatospora TaxID=2633591 RepID=UPI00365915A8